MSEEYTNAAKNAFIESLTIRAIEIAFEKGSTEGITQRAVHASIGSTLLQMAQAHFIGAAMLDEEENVVLKLSSEHPYISGKEGP